MKCYCLPNEVGALWWHLVFVAKLASGIRSIHLEPVVATKQALVLDRAEQRRKKPLPRQPLNDRCSGWQGFQKCMFADNGCREIQASLIPRGRLRLCTVPCPES